MMAESGLSYRSIGGIEMKDSNMVTLLHLRLLVGFLGERAQFAWWPTAFFDASSRLFLEPIFARTARLARYHGATAAARRLHDEHVGAGQVFHLFRLPEEIEQNLHASIQGEASEWPAFWALREPTAALEALALLADGTATVHEGPVAVGRSADLPAPELVKATAGVYLAAFRQGIRTYPYFVN